MVRPYSRRNDDDDADSNFDMTQIIAGSVSFFVLIIMCLIIIHLKARRKRRIARETEEDRTRAREEAIRRFIRRKKEAEEIILTMTLDSDEAGTANSDSEDDRNTLIQAPHSLSSQRDLAAEGISKIGTECSICFQEFEDGNLVAFSHNPHCTHFFHKECIVDWLARDDRCPTCRRNYLKNEHVEEHEDANVTATNRTDIEEGDITIMEEHPSNQEQLLPQNRDFGPEIIVENANSPTLASDSIINDQLCEAVENPNQDETGLASVTETYAPIRGDKHGNLNTRFPISTPSDNSFDEETAFVMQDIQHHTKPIEINAG